MIEDDPGPMKVAAPAIDRVWDIIEKVVQSFIALAKFAVLPPLALLVGVGLITKYTILGVTNGLLFILVLSVWYMIWLANSKLTPLTKKLSTCEFLIELIVYHLRPEYRGYTIESVEQGGETVARHTVKTAQESRIVDPRGPKGGER